MNIKGGALEFDIIANNSQLNKALEESKRRIQGVSDALVESGDTMDNVTQEIVECIDIQKKVIEQLEEEVRKLDTQFDELGPGQGQQDILDQANKIKQELEGEKEALVVLEKELENAAISASGFGQAFEEAEKTIDKAFRDIDFMADTHKAAINSLEKEYAELGTASAAAFMKGTVAGDKEYRALTKKQAAIKQEIATRKSLLAEIEATADALAKEERKLNETKEAVGKNESAHVSFRTQLRDVREELLQMEQSGTKATDPEKYRALQEEAGRLAGAISNVNKQTQILGHNQSALQGVISAISGVAGAFSAAQGAVSLFAGKNEDLQKIMVKVQSLMAITIGLQQVSQMLHEKSAFNLKFLGGIKEWWAGVVAKATVNENANTVATVANTAAQTAQTTATATNAAAQAANTAATGAQTAAATAGTVANIGLAGAFRLVGVAIKSIPVFGWILAGISALIGLVSHFTGKAKEAKKASEEFRKEVSKSASEQITVLMKLSEQWKRLGNDLNAQKKFLVENGDEIKKLTGKTLDLSQAEDLFIKNTGKFIEALILRARAEAQYKEVQEKTSKLANIDQQIDEEYNVLLKKGGTIGDKAIDKDINKLALNYTSQRMQELKKQRREALKETETFLSEFIRLSDSEKKILQDLGLSSVDALEGSIAAVEKALSGLKDKYKNAATDLERSDLKKQIKAQEELLNKLEGGKGSGGGKKTTDPYTEMLENRKKQYTQYAKWVNSKDEILQKAAKTEFAGLLKEGSSYIDFLKKQRDELLTLATRTPKENEKLKKLNNEIANETKNTVLGEFEKELQGQLSGARSILEMLNILEERRKALETDDSGLTNEKNDILNKQQENLAKQSETDLANATKAYREYIDSKVNADVKYFNRKKELEEKIAQATSDAQKKILQNQLEALNTLYDLNQTTDYDKLVEEYKTYQQKTADIAKEYDEKIALATKNNNQQLVDSLTKAKNKALSSAALEELQNSGAWERLFSNLDDLTTKQIEDLIAKIEAQRVQLGVELDPKDLETVLNKLNEAKNEITERNPFKALLGSIKEVKNELNTQSFLNSNDPFITQLNDKKKQYEEYKKWINSGNDTLVKGAGQAFDELLKEGSSYLDFLKRKRNELSGKVEITVEDQQAINALDALIRKEGEAGGATDTLSNKLKQMFKNSAASLDLVKGAFDSVVGGLTNMGLVGDEVTQELLGDISKMVGSASELATGIATGNPLGIIQGSIGFISSAFDVFNSRDRKAERAIRKHAEAVKELENAYTALAWAVDKALGETVYDNQKALISNMRQQQAHLQEMWRNEESKKKTDKNKVKEYKQQYEELGRQIEDTIAEIAASITQTTAKDLANELADAIVEAFGKGEDAAEAFEATAKKVMQNAVKNALKLQFLEQPLQKAIAQLQKDMGFDKEGNGTFDGLTAAEQQRFKNSISAIGANFAEAMKLYEDLFKELEEDGDPTTSLSGAIKGASQESIDLLAGQTNAVRVNQVEGNEIMRSQLLHLASIDAKVGVSNSYLASIDSKLSNNNSDPLRAQGIIN